MTLEGVTVTTETENRRHQGLAWVSSAGVAKGLSSGTRNPPIEIAREVLHHAERTDKGDI